MARYACSLVWVRRDLRLDDHVAILAAAEQSRRVVIAFVLDPELLARGRFGAPIVQVFCSALDALRADLRTYCSDLALLEGLAAQELPALAARLDAQAVFYNEDYEPEARERDAAVSKALLAANIDVHASVDHVYFGASEINQGDGQPYKVFTPYRRKWLEQHVTSRRLPVRSLAAARDKLLSRELIGETRAVPLPEDYGFTSSSAYPTVSERSAQQALRRFTAAGGPIETYITGRDVPALDGTSHLSPHLRAGTIGIRTCIEKAHSLMRERPGVATSIEVWISELVWRDFYHMVLYRFPRVATGPFIEATTSISWRTSQSEFEAWCAGRTGYPIVDAAMRQLNTQGWMHNRLRMITASFLTKDLLINWQKGERYFERHLADADLAANNGGWQWSASTGNDPVPYFRIFNPVLQSKKFDPDGIFIKRMLPQLGSVPLKYIHEPWKMAEPPAHYPPPMVDHAAARERALIAYRSIGLATR